MNHSVSVEGEELIVQEPVIRDLSNVNSNRITNNYATVSIKYNRECVFVQFHDFMMLMLVLTIM